MKNDAFVSVIIPSYNHAEFIGQAIKSVLNQSYKNFELIISDDNSNDESRNIIESFRDPRIIKIYRKENIGAVENLNNAIKIARGKYIAILNSDDYWKEEKLEKQVDVLDKNQSYGAVFSNCEFIDDKGKLLTRKNYIYYDIFKQDNLSRGEWLCKFFFEQNCLCHPSVLIRKDVYDKVGGYDPTLRQLPDFKMWINVVKNTNIYILEDKLVYFRILNNKTNSSASTEKNKIRCRNEHILIMRDFFDDMDLELFIEGFGDKLINKHITSREEIICEAAFLYLNMENKFNFLYSPIAIEKFSKLLKNETTRDILMKEYNFTFDDFFQLTGKTNFLCYEKYDHYIKTQMKLWDKILFILKKIRNTFKKG